MNNRNRTILLLLVCILIIWKSLQYFNIEKDESVDSQDSVLLGRLVPPQGSGGEFIEEITITVYYEALCSDSRNFVLRQLLPTYLQLSKHIILDLVPYGKARTIEKPDGTIEFQCQHGEIECLGNKVHACVIDLVKDPLLELQMVACMIDDNIIPFDAAEKCARKNNVNYDAIADCTNSQRSSELVKQYGIRTNQIHPTFIPTVSINGFMKVPLSEILKDLKKQVCKSFVFSRPPPECY